MKKGACCLLCVVLSMLVAVSVAAATSPDTDLPESARKTIQAQVGNGRIERLEKTTEDGETFYDVDATVDGKPASFTVSASGVLHQSLQIDELPKTVRKTVETQLNSGRIDQIDKTNEGDRFFYDIDMTTKDGAKQTIAVAADGKLHQQMQLDDVPEPLRSGIRDYAGGAKIDQIDKTTDNGKTFFDVDITTSEGKKDTFSIAASDGAVHQDVDLREMPEAARRTIEEQTAGASISSIDKSTENGEVFYDVDFIHDGKHSAFSVTADGTLYELVEPEQHLSREWLLILGCLLIAAFGGWTWFHSRLRKPNALS